MKELKTFFKAICSNDHVAQALWLIPLLSNLMVYGKDDEIPRGCSKKSERPKEWGNDSSFFSRCLRKC